MSGEILRFSKLTRQGVHDSCVHIAVLRPCAPVKRDGRAQAQTVAESVTEVARQESVSCEFLVDICPAVAGGDIDRILRDS